MAERKEKLMALGAEALADLLLEKGARHQDIDDSIDRIIATADEKIKRFKAKVSGLRKMSRFVDYKHSYAFSEELGEILDELCESNADSETGLQLISSFMETDETVFECCDDSSGMIDMTYSDSAARVFAKYAADCKNKEFIETLLLRLLEKDDYGVRTGLLDSAGKFLPKKNLRHMFEFYRDKLVVLDT
ncbi:MAG: DUF6880 family protein [Lentisphaeria bacterium]